MSRFRALGGNSGEAETRPVPLLSRTEIDAPGGLKMNVRV